MERDWARMFTDVVTVAPVTGHDNSGKRQFGTAVTYSAWINRRQRIVRNRQGQEVVSNMTVRLLTKDVITPEARLTLPAGYVPQQPELISTAMPRDERGVHHVVVYC